jgi:uncharacterized protein
MHHTNRFALVVLAMLWSPAAIAARMNLNQIDSGLDVSWPISDKVISTIITYKSMEQNSVPVQARFNVPKTASATNKVPAVVYVSGTAGNDGRGPFNAFALNEAGIATLEFDMWGARHVDPAPANRHLLGQTAPFAFGAFVFLSDQQEIDPAHIGIEGESMGGGITLRMASQEVLRRASRPVRYAAMLAFYPNCTEFVTAEDLMPVTGAPVHILLGDHDEDTSVEDCQALAAKIGAGITVYPGATHQWDEQHGRDTQFNDPLANRGAGGTVHVHADPALAQQSRAFGAEFFMKAFGLQ